MKVKLTNECKKYITLAQAPAAKRLIDMCKEDSMSCAEYAQMAANTLLHGNGARVLESAAKVSRNCRIYDYYFENSGCLDVWIDAIAMLNDKILVFGCYLSDIYQITGNRDQEFSNHAYVRTFKEV